MLGIKMMQVIAKIIVAIVIVLFVDHAHCLVIIMVIIWMSMKVKVTVSRDFPPLQPFPAQFTIICL